MNPTDYQSIIQDQQAAIVRLTDMVLDYTNVLEYASDKPGLAEQLEVAKLYQGDLTGMMNLWEMVDHCNVDLNDADYKQVNTAMRIFYGIQCHREPKEHSVYLEDGERVTSVLYPTDMLPVLRHTLHAMGVYEL